MLEIYFPRYTAYAVARNEFAIIEPMPYLTSRGFSIEKQDCVGILSEINESAILENP
jgi:hypothetical protein